MKDIELPPLPDADVTNNTNLLGYRYSYSAIAMQAYARAAVEADRAQRVPDGWKQEAAEAIDWLLNNIRRDAPQLSGKAMGNAVRVRDALLASTPAPAQQEPMEAFLLVDLSRELGVAASELTKELRGQGIGNYSVNMALPKSAADAMRRHFKAASAHQEPPQQERKPMTPEQVGIVCDSAGYLENGMAKADFINGIRHAERHHGIKE